MAASATSIVTELHKLSTARQEAEEEHRTRTAELDRIEQSLLGEITVSDLDDPTMRQAVASLASSWDAGCLLSDWAKQAKGTEFALSYYSVPVPVRSDDDEHGRQRYATKAVMIPTLGNPPPCRRGPDGVRRPSPEAVDRLEKLVERFCEGTGMVALNLDAQGHSEETIVRGPDGTWEHRGPAPYGVLQHRGTLYEAIRWFHHTIVAIEDGETDKAWHAPGEDLSASLSEGCLPFWPNSGQRP